MKTIFISSTYGDLKKERQAAIDLLDRTDHAVAMEKFFASDHEAKEVCLKRLQKCDAVVLILGERYGTLDPEEQVSITEIEYRTAKTLGLPVFVFLKVGAGGSWQSGETDNGRLSKHKAFKIRLDQEKYRKEFQTEEHLKLEILGAIREYEKAHGELGIRLSSLAKPEEFFRPYTNPDNLFNHCWALVGRADILGRLHGVVQSTKRVAILYGRGTSGKTKVLFEFSKEFQSRHQGRALLFLREGITLNDDTIKQVPAQPTTIVIDDAHRSIDLKFLLTAAQQYPDRVKLILSARPQGKDFIRTSLSETGFDVKEIDDLGELESLSLKDLKELARQVLGREREHLVDALVGATKDSPLITLVGARLLVDESIDPKLLEQHAKFQYTVLSRFEDAITGKVGPRIDRRLAHRTLALISALSPIHPHNSQFQELASAFLTIDKPTLIDAIGVLEENGILVRRGYSLRIVPDALSDHILHRACLTSTGQPTGYAEQVFNKFASFSAEKVLQNLAELDWRISRTGPKANLLGKIWADIEQEFRKGSNYVRTTILEWLEKIAYCQPSRALSVVEFAIRHPAKQSGNKKLSLIYRFTHGDVLRRLPKVIQAIGYNIDYLPRCCDLLWELGRDDDRRLNQYPDHPVRILTEFAGYKIGRPIYVSRVVVDAVEKWLKRSDAHKYAYSPLDVLDPILAREGLDFQSEGAQLHLRSFGISFKNTKTLRERAIGLIHETARSRSLRVALRASKSLTDALRSPHATLGRLIAEKEIDQWLPETKKILDILAELVRLKREPVIHVQIARDLRWYARHSSQELIRKGSQAILNSIPNTCEYRLTKALWFNSWDWYDEWDQVHRDYDRLAKLTETKVREIVREFLQEHRRPEVGLKQLLDAMDEFRKAGLASNPGYFLSVLAQTDATYAGKMCVLLIRRPGVRLALDLSSLLPSVRRANKGLAREIIKNVLKAKNENTCLAVAHFLAWNISSEDLDLSDIRAVERLLRHPKDDVQKTAIHCLKNFRGKWARKGVELALGIDLQENQELANALFDVFDDQHGIPFDHLTGKDVSILLKKVVCIPEITYQIDEFLGSATKQFPTKVGDLFLKRLDIGKKLRGGGKKYDPLPYSGLQHAFKGISACQDYGSILDKILNRACVAKGLDTFWLPRLFANVSDGYCQSTLDRLSAFIESNGAQRLQAVSLLLEEAPARFLFDHMDFVVGLLERAHDIGEECYQRVGGKLYSCALTEGRHGTAGQPMPQDVSLRERSGQALSKTLPGSPAYRFYESLKQLAEGNIKDELARFEEEFAG